MSESSPTVSVVVPARNAAAYIRATVESALAQTNVELEVVVADDGSTDDTLAIASGFVDERVIALSGGPSNAAAARNRAIRASTGPFVAFLDADDLWYPTKLELQLKALDAPGVAAVGALFRFRMDERVFGIRGEIITEEKLARVREARLMPVTFSSVVVRRATLERVGLFDESLRYGEDLELLARLAADGVIVVLDGVLGEYRIHPGGMSRNNQVENERWLRFIEARTRARASGDDLTWESFTLDDAGPSRRERRTASAARIYQQAGSRFASGERLSAAAMLLGAFFRDPRYTLSKVRRQQLWRRSP